MNNMIIEERLQRYQPQSKQDELNALKEIAQEITLAALSRAEFFKLGAFQGGTCLRILYNLQRFSEDLDFILYEPNKAFCWKKYLSEIQLEFSAYGLSLSVRDRSEVDGNVKKAFLKESSFGQVLKLSYQRNKADVQTIMIKLEIDTNPPLGSDFETKLLEFPVPFSVNSQTLPSLFSGKMHALLCRDYTKGRDWYDFIWYVTRKTELNYSLLQNALFQLGPWQGQDTKVNKDWIRDALLKKITTIDWEKAKADILNFVNPREHQAISMWGEDFFKYYIGKL